MLLIAFSTSLGFCRCSKTPINETIVASVFLTNSTVSDKLCFISFLSPIIEFPNSTNISDGSYPMTSKPFFYAAETKYPAPAPKSASFPDISPISASDSSRNSTFGT